jgi:outer membrane receptor protein involved in Fe transport
MAGVEAMQGSNESSFGDTDGVNLMVSYLKSAVDIGDMTTLLGGVTYMQGKNGFGDTKIYGADLTLRTTFDSYSSLTWQNELLYREKDLENGLVADQAGLYSELIYDYNQNWSGGVRYDTIFKNVADEPEGLDKYSAMLMYRPFEFTKLRLQYSYDKSKFFAGEQKNVQEILLDLTFEAGAHGAHAF